MTTANKITIARIMLIPVFVMMAIYYGRSVESGDPNPWLRFWAVFVFLVAAVSDGLDGYFARKYNQRSRLGVILDPIADKGLLLAGIITLSFSNWGYEFPLWFPVTVIARDSVIVVGTVVLHLLVGHVEVAPSFVGKLATVFQMIAVGAVMLQAPMFYRVIAFKGGPFELQLLDIPVMFATAFTLISGVGYFIFGLRQLAEGGHGNAGS
jgi:cardiolipin synthase